MKHIFFGANFEVKLKETGIISSSALSKKKLNNMIQTMFIFVFAFKSCVAINRTKNAIPVNNNPIPIFVYVLTAIFFSLSLWNNLR